MRLDKTNQPKFWTPEYEAMMIKYHQDNKTWGTSGKLQVKNIVPIIEKYDVQRVLDFGCGKGELIKALESFYDFDIRYGLVRLSIDGYDPFVAKFSAPLGNFCRYQLITCTDVLEHIEEEFLVALLKYLWVRLSHDGHCYFTIALTEAKAILPDGRNAHLIVKDTEWWVDKLLEVFTTVEILAEDTRQLTVLCN